MNVFLLANCNVRGRHVMAFHDGLEIATFVMATMAMIMASAPHFPRFKQSMVFVRDTVLWVALVLIVAFVIVVGWTRFSEARQHRADEKAAAHATLPQLPAAVPRRGPGSATVVGGRRNDTQM